MEKKQKFMEFMFVRVPRIWLRLEAALWIFRHGSFGPKDSFTNSVSRETRLVTQNDENRPLWPLKHRFRGLL